MAKFSPSQPVLITNRAAPLAATILHECHQKPGWYWVELENGEHKRIRGKFLKARKGNE